MCICIQNEQRTVLTSHNSHMSIGQTVPLAGRNFQINTLFRG